MSYFFIIVGLIAFWIIFGIALIHLMKAFDDWDWRNMGLGNPPDEWCVNDGYFRFSGIKNNCKICLNMKSKSKN